MEVIKHDNIIYIQRIHDIGGVETYCYELVKKYHDLDIAVVCKNCSPVQRKRIRKYCKVYIHKEQPIECKVIVTNWDTSIIKYVNEDAKVYTGIHVDYTHPTQTIIKDDPRITHIGITEDSKAKYEKITGIKRTILCRNPLEIEKDDKILILMSACRLTVEKGGHRLLALANELDRQGIKYIWFLFTTDEYENNVVWNNKNIIRMKNRLDLGGFYNIADWYIQLSEVEGDSYSLREALYRGTPIVVCELPYFKEYGIEDNKQALFLDLNCNNVESVAKRMTKPLKFKFDPIQDDYDKIFVKSKSHYKEDMNKKVKLKAEMVFFDLKDNVTRFIGDTWITDEDRYIDLLDNGIMVSEIERE